MFTAGLCDFEADICDWTQELSSDQFDWKRDRNGTSSTGTGPLYDHTTESQYGKYLVFTVKVYFNAEQFFYVFEAYLYVRYYSPFKNCNVIIIHGIPVFADFMWKRRSQSFNKV